MKTIFVMMLYVVVGTAGGWVVTFLSNLAGGFGALVGSLGQLKHLTGVRKVITVGCCSLGQAYVFLIWTAFVVAYTTTITHHQPVVRWLVWIAAFYVAMVPEISAASDSIHEEKEDSKLRYSVPSIALHISSFLNVVGFFLFVFLPNLMLYGWAWVPWVSAVAHP